MAQRPSTASASPVAGAAPPSLLLVDDDPGAIQLMRRILADVGTLRFATDGFSALRLARESEPDIILLDAEMPGLTGFQVLEAVKAEANLKHVPVIFITGRTDADFEVLALQKGAADFIGKPFTSSRVLARVSTHLRMKQMADELRRAASTDPLTGIANRLAFEQAIEREWLRARRNGQSLSLLLVDVDHFKLFNDYYGHQKGDGCLRQVAQALVAACRRPSDLVARYGGEEFVLLLPETPRAGTQLVAEKVLATVRSLGIAHQPSPTSEVVSVSIGMATIDNVGAWGTSPAAQSNGSDAHGASRSFSTDTLIRVADRALYAAKAAGRAQAKLLELSELAIDDIEDSMMVRMLLQNMPGA